MSDWGGEFRTLHTYLLANGITHQLSCPYTSQQNSRVERKNRHVVEVSLTILTHSHIPFQFWPYAFHETIYLINILPSRSLHY